VGLTPTTAGISETSDLDLLFDRYAGLVLGIACRILGDPIEAEDVAQEVFFYVYRKSQLYDPSKGSIRAWIIQIAFSRALDRKLHLARWRLYRGPDLGALGMPGGTNPEQEIDRSLSREHLERALTELTEMQRRTIEFFYFADLDLREISERLNEPLGCVRHHLYRGLEHLRKSTVLSTLRRK
jgi:RNA polymerase sigma-70 factor, ECF subfamily